MKKNSCIGYQPAKPGREHTPEEIALIKDHIENWNPAGHVLDHIKNGNYQKGADYIKNFIESGLGV